MDWSITLGKHVAMRALSTSPGIQYAQCWEDPRTLLQGLNITEEDDVLSIASAGDNTFAILLENPRSVVAVDRDPVDRKSVV